MTRSDAARRQQAASPLRWSNKVLHPMIPGPKTKRAPEGARFVLAGGPGFEPGSAESESAVLPLDDPPILAGLAAPV